MKLRSQAATEYLMTYGWALIIVIVVAAVLFSLGIFSPSPGATINGFTGYTGSSAGASCSSKNGFLLTLYNSNPNPIQITGIMFNSSSGMNIKSIDVLGELGTYNSPSHIAVIEYNGNNIGNLTVQPGSYFTLLVSNVSCTSSFSTQVSVLFNSNGLYYSIQGTVTGSANPTFYLPSLPSSIPSSAVYLAPITISNYQSTAAPNPFQQMINISSSSSLWSYINTSYKYFGQNVEFFYSNGTIIPSWLENYTSSHAIWWIKIGSIPASSTLTVYIGFAPKTTNLFDTKNSAGQIIVGEAPQLSPTYGEYDDGQVVFLAYGYFDNTLDGWSANVYSGSFTPTSTSSGIEMINDVENEGTYILPPNNGNIPTIPIIIEEAWYESSSADASTISLFGNTNSQIAADSVGSTFGGYTPAASDSTYIQYEYCSCQPDAFLKSSVTNAILSSTGFPTGAYTFYLYMILNSSFARAGYYEYSTNQAWVPLSFLGTYSSHTTNSTQASITYNPFNYGTLEIGAGDGSAYSYQYIEWVVARAYPPNGVMPSVSFGNVV